MAERNINLVEAKKNVSDAFLGKHSIYSIRGNDRVKVFSTNELSSKLESLVVAAGSPFRVDCLVVPNGEKVKLDAEKKCVPVYGAGKETLAIVSDVEDFFFEPSPTSTILIASKAKLKNKKVATAADNTKDVMPNINAKGKFGYTPLHSAAVSGDEAECDRLIAAGARKTIKDNSGKMPWQKALFAENDVLAEKLKP